MSARIWIKKLQERPILIVGIMFLLFMVFVNGIIKKTIDNANDLTTVPIAKAQTKAKASVSPTKEKSVLPIASPLETSAEKNDRTLQNSKNPESSASIGDKEIIYEPSIKDNILLQ